MITRAIIGGLLMMIMLLGTYGFSMRIKNNNLSTKVANRDKAIEAYEQLIKTIPFNGMASERRDNAKKDINATLSNDDIIIDGIYGL